MKADDLIKEMTETLDCMSTNERMAFAAHAIQEVALHGGSTHNDSMALLSTAMMDCHLNWRQMMEDDGYEEEDIIKEREDEAAA